MENIDIDKEISENIDIDKEISENIDIDRIWNRLEFGISNRANHISTHKTHLFLNKKCTMSITDRTIFHYIAAS